MLLLIDNYDSFVHNLARYFERLGVATRVVRNDEHDLHALESLQPSAIVISPGPCTPSDAGVSIEVVRQFSGRVPILGVCLGHQAIAQAFGAGIVRAPRPIHGQSSPINHDGTGLFRGLPSPLNVGRYHSLVVARDSLPARLKVHATTDDGTIMAIADSRAKLFGVQFHPESILTEGGFVLLANFLRLAGLKVATSDADELFRSEFLAPPIVKRALPSRPVTF